MVVAVAAAVAVVAALAEAMVPLRMILCLQIVRFPCFLKRRNGQTYGPMDLRTDPLIEMRGRKSHVLQWVESYTTSKSDNTI